MIDSTATPSSRPATVGSERFRLARLARDAALRVPGVAGTDTGPIDTFISVGGGERLEGVRCVATKDGGYEITLRLICRLVPLLALSEQVKAAVTRAALSAAIPLDGVNVCVAALNDGEES